MFFKLAKIDGYTSAIWHEMGGCLQFSADICAACRVSIFDAYNIASF
jgi:hypothetical protein